MNFYTYIRLLRVLIFLNILSSIFISAGSGISKKNFNQKILVDLKVKKIYFLNGTRLKLGLSKNNRIFRLTKNQTAGKKKRKPCR